MAEASHTHHIKLLWISFIALGLFVVFLWQQATVFDSSSKNALRGSLVQIGQKGGKSVVLVSFKNGEISEPLMNDTMSIVVTDSGASLSDGVALSRALTAGKKVLGYKYSSVDAAAEIAAKVRSDAGEPLSYSTLFPGTFFVSDEKRGEDTFIDDFETQYGVEFLPLTDVTLNRDARYVFLSNSTGVILTVRGVLWCGDGVTNKMEQCDGGQGIEDGCSDVCVFNNECSDGIDNDGDTLIDAPTTEVALTLDQAKQPFASYADALGEKAYLFARSNQVIHVWEILLSPLVRGRTLSIPLNSTSAFSGDYFGDGAVVVNPLDHKAYIAGVNSDGQKFIARADLSTMSFNAASDLASLDNADANLATAIMDPQGRYAYFATFVTGGTNRIVKFDLQTFARVGFIDVFNGGANRNGFLTSFMAPDGSYAFFGDAQGNLVRINLQTFSSPSSSDILHFTRSDGAQNSLQVSAIASSGTEAYVVSVPRLAVAPDTQNSSEIYTVDLQAFTLKNTFILPASDGRIFELTVDSVSGNLLLGTRLPNVLPVNAKILELTPTFTRVSSYPMDTVGSYEVRPIFVYYYNSIRTLFAALNLDPDIFVRYRASDTDPSCQL